MVLFRVTVIFLTQPNNLNIQGKQKRLASILCDFYFDHMMEKGDNKKRAIEAD